MRHIILGWGLALAIVVLLSLTASAAEETMLVVSADPPTTDGVSYVILSGNVKMTEGEFQLSGSENNKPPLHYLGATGSISAFAMSETGVTLITDTWRADDLSMFFWPNGIIIDRAKKTANGGNPFSLKHSVEVRQAAMISLISGERGGVILEWGDFMFPIPIVKGRAFFPEPATYYIWLKEKSGEETQAEVVVPDGTDEDETVDIAKGKWFLLEWMGGPDWVHPDYPMRWMPNKDFFPASFMTLQWEMPGDETDDPGTGGAEWITVNLKQHPPDRLTEPYSIPPVRALNDAIRLNPSGGLEFYLCRDDGGKSYFVERNTPGLEIRGGNNPKMQHAWAEYTGNGVWVWTPEDKPYASPN